MLKMLSFPTDLKQKADVMLKINEFAPKVNELISRINCWKMMGE